VTVKILAVDDSATMRKILGMTFAGEDAVVVTASSADEALAKARQSPPDVVFADAALAGTDGYALATALKSDPALANAAVILLASQHHPFDEGKGRASGVDDHVAKPFDTQVVLDKVADVLRRPRARASAAAPAVVAAPPPPPPAAPTPARASKQTMAFGSPPVPPPPAPPAAPKPVLELADEEVVPGPAAKPAPIAPKPAPVAAPARTFSAPAKPAPVAAPAAPPAPARPASRPAMAAAAAIEGGMAAKLENLGLTKEQIEGVLALSREVVEQVVWEVVPDLAETLIREEIQRLTRE
jgi:CheY-like chemotaxis protein